MLDTNYLSAIVCLVETKKGKTMQPKLAVNDLTRAVLGVLDGYEVTARDLAELDSYLGQFARRVVERNGATSGPHKSLSELGAILA